MKWKKWLKFDLYKKLWFWAGRPFTYILRDIWHEAEWIFQALFFWLGALTLWLSGSWVLTGIIWGVYTLGYVAGHLWWGTPYIPKEGENGKITVISYRRKR